MIDNVEMLSLEASRVRAGEWLIEGYKVVRVRGFGWCIEGDGHEKTLADVHERIRELKGW